MEKRTRRRQDRCRITGCTRPAFADMFGRHQLTVCQEHACDIYEEVTSAGLEYIPLWREREKDRLYAGEQVWDDVIKRQPKKVPAEPATGTIYYLRCGAYIKIGWTSSVDSRMKAYQPDSVLLATEPGTKHDESNRHKRFAADLTHGREWFTMSASLMHHIDTVTAKYGTPDPVSFAAKPVQIRRDTTTTPVTPRGWVRTHR